MSADKPRCNWDTGTAGSGPRKCGRPAKGRTDLSYRDDVLVCGIHARTARTWGCTVKPLETTR